jgi:MFS family permease
MFSAVTGISVALGPLVGGAVVEGIAWTITFILIAPGAGALADRIGERPLILGGLSLQAIGLTWIALIADAGLRYGELVLPLIVAGVGVSLAIPAGQNSVVGRIPVGQLGKAAGANSMMRELGGVFGIAVVVAVFAAAGSYASASAFSDGFSAAVAVAAGLSLLGAIVGAVLPGRTGVGAEVEAPMPAAAVESEA